MEGIEEGAGRMYATMATFRRKTEHNKMKDASINRIAGLPTDIWPIIAAILAMSGQSDIMWNYRLNPKYPASNLFDFWGGRYLLMIPGMITYQTLFLVFLRATEDQANPFEKNSR